MREKEKEIVKRWMHKERVCVWKNERERQRETERDRERQRDLGPCSK